MSHLDVWGQRDEERGAAVHPGMVDVPGSRVWPWSRERWFALLAAATVVVILLVCLYPFRFSIRHGHLHAVGALVGSWAKPPGPIDFILNIALYTPLGVFGALSTSRRSRRPWRRMALVTAGAALLSIAVELTQYFDATRYTAASDVYANTLGAFLGAAGVVLLSGAERQPEHRQRAPLCAFAQLSRSPIVRLKTSLPGAESGSRRK